MTCPHTILDWRVINTISSCSNTFILWNSNSVFLHLVLKDEICQSLPNNIKPKVAWPVWNQNGNGTGAMTTVKNEVFIGL